MRQIIVLRKLRIPLKQITDILKSKDAAIAINIFQQNLANIEDEITALSTIKSVIQAFLEKLQLQNNDYMLIDDESLLEIVDSLTVSKINFKEKKSMDELDKANKKLNKLTDNDVRIVCFPPMTVASVYEVNKIPHMERKLKPVS